MARGTRGEGLLIRGGTVITLGDAGRVIRGHDLVLEGGRIRALEPSRGGGSSRLRVIDAGGKVVLPGLINAHMHFYSTLVRGLGKAEPAHDFDGVLRNLWWRLDKALGLEDCYASALIMMLEAIRHGTTALIDHHASPGAVAGSLDEIARAARETGLRVCLAYEVSDRDGGEVAREGLAENARFIRACQQREDGYIAALFGLHAGFTLSDDTLAAAGAMARELNAGCHIHVAESPSDKEHSRSCHGMRVVERLERFGILGEKSIAAHCVHVDDREMDILGATRTMVAHNPQSNLNNAVGIADIIRMQDKGIVVGLGTDAMTVDMFEEVRVALWAQRHARRDPAAGFMQAVSALCRGNPAIAERVWGLPLGRIEAGVAADIILVDYDPPTPLDEETYLGHLVFGISQAVVDTTIVGGRVLMENKKLALDLDEERIAARSRELARALWRRF